MNIKDAENYLILAHIAIDRKISEIYSYTTNNELVLIEISTSCSDINDKDLYMFSFDSSNEIPFKISFIVISPEDCEKWKDNSIKIHKGINEIKYSSLNLVKTYKEAAPITVNELITYLKTLPQNYLCYDGDFTIDTRFIKKDDSQKRVYFL